MSRNHMKVSRISESMIGKRRWIAYLDLLGVRNLLKTGRLVNVIKIYDTAIEDLQRIVGPKGPYGINSMWFSDTFVIYAADDTPKSFSWLEQATRLFFDKLILSEVPVRGAISIGDLYTNRKNGVIVGDALVSAYEYGESQNWIGLLLTPQVVMWMYENDLNPNERLNYARLLDTKVLKNAASTEIFAYRMSGSMPDIDQQIIYSKIEELGGTVPAEVRPKYDRTLRFIRKNKLNAGS